MSEDAANVINGWEKVLPILINVKLTAFLKSNYIGFKEKGLVWSMRVLIISILQR
jgi:hypothetical protein